MVNLSDKELKERLELHDKWDFVSGYWRVSKPLWNLSKNIPQDAPDCWLSKTEGDYYIGMSFHIAPFTTPRGAGKIGLNIHYRPADFLLARSHDPYNPWGIRAVKKENVERTCMNFWEWLPGVLVYDDSVKYTLPSPELSAYAGTEWADNDRRVFHGLYNDEAMRDLQGKYLASINSITGPRFAGWPFGYRQFKDSVMVWIHSETHEIHCMILADCIQSGERYHYFNKKLYNPGDYLGAWLRKPEKWDSRRTLKYLYKSRLLQLDGFHELGLVAAASAVETAFYEIVLFLENNNAGIAKKKIKDHTFMDRAEVLIASYGYVLPATLIQNLKSAYRARNSIAHELNNFSPEVASQHIDNFEKTIEWFSQQI